MKKLIGILALFVAAGCGEGTGTMLGDWGPVEPDEQEILVSQEGIAGSWTRDQDWLVSPVLDASGGASQVGAIIETFNIAAMPAIEARLLSDGVPVTDWQPLEETWSEVAHHVAVSLFDAEGDGAELRMPVDAIDAVRHLQWSAVVPGDPGAADAEVPDGDLQTQRAALAAELSGLGIVTREAWGARATRCTSTDTKRRVAVHYTVTPSSDPATRVRAIQRYHQDTRGWCDLGYHFLIGIDGKIYEGRPMHLVGAHVANHNTGTLGISFVGCFHPSGCDAMGPTTPPQAMIDAGGRLLGSLSRLQNIALNRTQVRGHREFPGASTDCPGDNLFARLDDLLAVGRQSDLGSTPSEPPPTPEPEVTLPTQPSPGTACEALGCGVCAQASGCTWCAGKGACVDAAQTCAWPGKVGEETCWDALWPCDEASCWNPTASLQACGSWRVDEDFGSGVYSVHRYWATLPAGGPVTFKLQRTGGLFQPALLVADRAGRMVYGSEATPLDARVAVSQVRSGRSGSLAEVTLTASQDVDVYLYVTGWSVLDASFLGTLSTSSAYTLSAAQNCGAPAPLEPSASGSCSGLTCDTCEASSGCSWCASRGACGDAEAACTWAGEVGTLACWDALWPCAVGRCWEPSATFATCGAWSRDEDFASGRFTVHRYSAVVPAGGPVTLRLERTGGTYQPALLVADAAGEVIAAGEVTAQHQGFSVLQAASGRSGAVSEVTLEAAVETRVYVYVTSWGVLDAGFSGSVPTSARYRLSAVHVCSP